MPTAALDEALDHARRSMAADEAFYGRGDRRAMRPLWVIANATDERGDRAATVPICQRILDVDRAVLGDRHPIVDHINVGTALGGTNGRHACAATAYARAIAIIDRAMRAGHPDVAHALLNAAETTRAQGKLVEAEQALARTRAIWTKAHGAAHPYKESLASAHGRACRCGGGARARDRRRDPHASPSRRRSMIRRGRSRSSPRRERRSPCRARARRRGWQRRRRGWRRTAGGEAR